MNYKQLANDIAIDNEIVEEINLKYSLSEVDWLKIYQQYINFPVLKNNLGYNYVANEMMVNFQIVALKKNISQVEGILPNIHELWNTNNNQLNINLVYKENGNDITDLSDYKDQYKLNYEEALTFISNEEISVFNITKLWQILGQKIIDFHPVQGALMYRAVDLEIYNHHQRLLTPCITSEQITKQIEALVKLCTFKNERDEYANLLIATLIKIHLLKLAPFYRFNEQLADLVALWFLQKQKYKFYYFPTNYLLSFNSQLLSRAICDNRFSYREQDISLLMSGMLEVINNYLTAYIYIKNASDILVSDLDILTNRERDYLFIILTSHFRTDYFNWEMLNDELAKLGAQTTKAGVLKILNRLEQKRIISSTMVQRSKMFKINS